MPIQFRVLPQDRVVHIKCDGVVSLGEILRLEVSVVDDPHFDPEYTEVLDLRDVEKLDLVHSDVRKIVGYEKSHGRYIGHRKVAFVAPADLEFGLGRMYEMLEDESPMETRIFRDIEAACEWTGLSVPLLDTWEEP